MSSWKRKKPIGNFQSSYVKRYEPDNEIISQVSLYSYDRRAQYKSAVEIDDNIYDNEFFDNINELVEGYEKLFSRLQLDNSGQFINKMRQFRYNENLLYHESLDIYFVDLFGRLIKFVSLYNDTALESFCDLFITTKNEKIIETFNPFYLMNFNKKYYGYI